MGPSTDDVRSRLHPLFDRASGLQDAVDERLPGPTKLGFLTLYVYSTRGLDRLDALADSRHWDRWVRVAVALVLWIQLSGVALLALAAVRALGQTGTTALNDPANTVAVPGFNAFMPVAATPYVVAGLIVATVVHEAGHAVACRADDVPVREWGVALLFGVVPLAGYVMPGEELDAASRSVRLRVYAVGVFQNLVVAALALAVLLSPVTASPTEAFLAYFGWAAAGGAPPTAGTVASLGVATNLSFWLVLLNANFGLLNALPVTALDGGRVLSLWIEGLADRTGREVSPRARSLAVNAASVVVVLLLGVAILGPHLWT